MAIPSTPTNVYVQQGNGQVFVSFDISAGATSYPILRSTDGVSFIQIAAPAVNSYLDTSVTDGTQYFYQVQATSVDGTSVASVAQSVIPTLTSEVSLGQLRLMSQQRADRVNSNFVTLPEWNSYINQSYFELYDLLVTLYEDYYVAPVTIFRTNGTDAQYTLPNGVATFQDENGDDFIPRPLYKLLGVDCGLANTGNAWISLGKFDFIARNRYIYPNLTSTFMGVFNMQYRLVGNKLMFIPTPSGAQYVRLWYVPKLAQLLQDTDTADGISGWTEYIIVDAAIKALQKEESDISALMVQKQALIKRIEDSAMNRDIGQPDTISATRNWNSRNGGGGGDSNGSWGGY